MNSLNEARYRGPSDIDPIFFGGGDEGEDFSALSDEQLMAMVNKVFTLGHKRREQLGGRSQVVALTRVGGLPRGLLPALGGRRPSNAAERMAGARQPRRQPPTGMPE